MPPSRKRRFALSAMLLFVLWLLLTNTLQPQEIITGIGVTLLLAWISLDRMTLLDDIKLSVALPVYLLQYLLLFFHALVRANLDVARRVLSPHLPIRPEIVTVNTRLTSNLGILLLANSITLTPGTLTIDVEAQTLHIHWIDCPPGTTPQQATRTIIAHFENSIEKFLA